MTIVVGKRARSVNYESFGDLTDAAVVAIHPHGVEFDADLPPETVAAIWSRMTSRDDADETARATLRGADGASNLAEMVRAYVLGDPMPDPFYPA